MHTIPNRIAICSLMIIGEKNIHEWNRNNQWSHACATGSDKISEFTSMYDTVKLILLRYASLCTTQFNMKINERFFETRVIATGEKKSKS